MDVGLDEAGDHQPPVELFLRRVGGDMGRDVGDAAVRDADVEERLIVSGQPALTQDEIERHGGLLRRFGAAEIGGLELGIIGQSRRVVGAHDLS